MCMLSFLSEAQKASDIPERRIKRWEHEHVLEAVQQRLDKNPQAMRQRREFLGFLDGASADG